MLILTMMMAILLYAVLFLLPLIVILFLTNIIYSNYRRHRHRSQMDLNTMTTFRSLLLGVVNNKSSFLQNEDVTCFYQQVASSSMVDNNNKLQQQANSTNTTASINNNTGHGHSSSSANEKSNNNNGGDRSRLNSITIDYLPTNNFSFHTCELNGVNITESKSLLVLFAWLFAKERHLDKYRQLYMDQGFDVLTIKVHVRDFIIPTVGSHVIAANVVRFIEEYHNKYDSMIFHAFSVGAYQMGEVIVMLNQKQNSEVKNIVRKKLKGMVYDSAADVNEAPVGLSKATTSNRLLQWAICSLMNVHFRWCYHLATRHYIASSQVIHQNEFRCPTLVFLSKDDEVVNYVDQIATVDKWRQQGINVTVKCWEQSPHVSHFFKHPEEYRQTVIEFLKNISQEVKK